MKKLRCFVVVALLFGQVLFPFSVKNFVFAQTQTQSQKSDKYADKIRAVEEFV
ncbi:MAG TPA: hypothetical protein VK892_02985 [Pyrinomonadaceae bacterium]|nr:hypothetical protein [Pyrinomonadaceae bacterium]